MVGDHGVHVEEHRDAEVLDHVEVTGGVVRGLQERRVEVLQVGQLQMEPLRGLEMLRELLLLL